MAARKKASAKIGAVWSAKDKNRITAMVEKWRGLLLLNGHHVHVKFSDTARVDDDGKENSGACAEMASNHPYMSGHALTVYPSLLDELDAGEVERKIIHELAHIITFPQRELARRLFRDMFVTAEESKNACETATDWIANIVWALYDSGKGRR
jgi:hypothetical protein